MSFFLFFGGQTKIQWPDAGRLPESGITIRLSNKVFNFIRAVHNGAFFSFFLKLRLCFVDG